MSREVDVKALISHIVRGDGADKCRICMGDTSEGQVYLGDTVMMDGERPVTLAELLEVISGVEMETSTILPRTVCPTCFKAATVAAPFIQLCKNTNQKWMQISDCLLNLDYTVHAVSKAAKSTFICFDTDEIQIVECKDKVTNVKKAHKVLKSVFRKPNYIVQDTNETLDSDMKCPECGKAYASIYLLNGHLKDIDKKMCCYCKEIIDIEDFACHVRKHGAVLFTCDICKHMFRSKSKYLRHVTLCKRKGKHVCADCGQTFVSASQLVMHYSAKHKTKICTGCDKKFMSKICFKNHAKYCSNSKSKEDGEIYICDHCSKEYRQKNSLRVHIRINHGAGWVFQCEQCGKKFSNPAHLREHDNKHNKVADRYVCSICGTKYSTRRGFERHSKKHFDENGKLTTYMPTPYPKKKEKNDNIYICSVCGKKYSTSMAFERHYKKHVEENGNLTETYTPKLYPKVKRTYKHCIVCDFATTDRKKLERHLSVKHNILQWEEVII